MDNKHVAEKIIFCFHCGVSRGFGDMEIKDRQTIKSVERQLQTENEEYKT